MSFIFPLAFVIILLLIFSGINSTEKKTDDFKNYISQKGELLRFYQDLSYFASKHNNHYIFFYRNKNSVLHRGKVFINASEFEITEDRVVPDDKNMSGYNDFSKTEPVLEATVLEEKVISTEKGNLRILLISADIELGNKVFLNNLPAPDGKYKIGFLHYIYVKDGQVC